MTRTSSKAGFQIESSTHGFDLLGMAAARLARRVRRCRPGCAFLRLQPAVGERMRAVLMCLADG